jgi:cell division protein FtsB
LTGAKIKGYDERANTSISVDWPIDSGGKEEPMALEKSAKQNEQNKLSMGLAAVVVGILIVVIMVACFGLYQRLVKNRERISELQSEIVKEEQRAEDIEEYRKYTETREYIEEVAREKLGLVYEGEVIFKEASSD